MEMGQGTDKDKKGKKGGRTMTCAWHLRPHWMCMEMGLEHSTQRNLQLAKTCRRLWIPPNSVEDIDHSCHTEAKSGLLTPKVLQTHTTPRSYWESTTMITGEITAIYSNSYQPNSPNQLL